MKKYYKFKEQISKQKATLLWEYNFDLKEEIFQNIESDIYNPHNSKEQKELIISLYLFFISLEKYKQGNFWGKTILNQENEHSKRKEFYESFRNFLKRYKLFSLHKNKNSTKEFLIHAVIPKYYASDFLKIIENIYKNEQDLEYLLFIDKNEIEKYFKSSIKSIQELMEHKETLIILKNLVYRTVKTFDNITKNSSENKFNLPKWFFEKIKAYLKNKKNLRKNRYTISFSNNLAYIDIDLDKDTLYFFNNKQHLIKSKIDSNNKTILFTQEPKYIIVYKKHELIDEIEDYFSSNYDRWEIANNNSFYCYELQNELIGEEIGEFECKLFEEIDNQDNQKEIKIKPLNNKFPPYLKYTESNIVTFFDGFKIENFDDFSQIFLNNKKITEPILNLESNIYELKAISGLGDIVKSKKILIVPYCDIKKIDNKIYINGKKCVNNIKINNFEFEFENIQIFLQNRQTLQKENNLLFREKHNYQITIDKIPKYIKHPKIIYLDSKNNIIDKIRINKNNKKIDISDEIKKYSSFPIKIYLQHKDIYDYKKTLIGTVYFLKIEQYEDYISIYPDINKFFFVIQSRYDIFSTPLKTEKNIIKYEDLPKPKYGDFNIIVYDKKTNNEIKRKIITNNKLKSNDKFINYLLKSDNFAPPNIKSKELKNFLKKLKNINYHFLDEIIIEKLNLLLEEVYKNFQKEIDNFIEKEQTTIIKLKYMLLFDKRISLKLNKEYKDIDENVILAIKVKFYDEITSINPENLLDLFFEKLQKNNKKDRKKIFAILEYPSIQKIINI